MSGEMKMEVVLVVSALIAVGLLGYLFYILFRGEAL